MPLGQKISLVGEIPFSDFCMPFCHIVKLGQANQWLKPIALCKKTIDDAETFKQHQLVLASYFNDTVKTPFYIIPGFAETKGLHQIVFFEKDEAQKFQKKFGKRYALDEDALDSNLTILAERKKRLDWRPKDPRLMPYLKNALLLDQKALQVAA